MRGPVEVLQVEHGGGAAGAVPLTWPQRHIHRTLDAMPGVPAYAQLYLTTPAAGAGVTDTVNAVVALVERHAILRTEIVGQGPLAQQRAREAGQIEIRLVDADTGPPVRTTADLFEPAVAAGSPFCAALVVRDGAVGRVVCRVAHHLTDEWGLSVLRRDLGRLLADPGSHARDAVQPWHVAEWEQSDAGSAAAARTDAYLCRVLASVPPTMFPRRSSPGSPRYRFGRLRSASAAASLAGLSRVRGTTAAGALLAAVGAAVAGRAGLDAALLYLLAHNRTDPLWQEYAGPMVQEIPVALDGIDVGGSALVRAASLMSLQAQAVAHHDPALMDERLGEAGRRRGATMDGLGHAVVLNLHAGHPAASMRGTTVPGSGAGPMPGPSSFTWTGGTDVENLDLFLDVRAGRYETVVDARVDTAAMDAEQLPTMLGQIEDLLASFTRRPAGRPAG